MKSRFRRASNISDPFGCSTCGCFITPGTTKCPNCENNPYISPKNYSAAEHKGRHPLSAIKQKFHVVSHA